MQKSDLKNGMIVECLNGERYFILDDRALTMTGYNPLDFYDDELYCTGCAEYNIIKVYNVVSRNVYTIRDIFDDANLELIWERSDKEPIIELTLEDIAEKFKVNVDQIRIRK